MNAHPSPAAATPPPIHPVPRSLRFGSFLLAVLLTFLLIWLLGFLVRDIGQIDGPDYQKIRSEFVNEQDEEQSSALQSQIADLEKQISRQDEIQKDLQRSMDNARETMQQLMDLHRLSLEKQTNPSEQERAALATAQQRFLDSQERFEAANSKISQLNQERYELGTSLEEIRKRIADEEKPAREKFESQLHRHQFKIASLKLALAVPLFLLSAWWFFRKRHSPYRLVPLAALAATFWKLGGVMFEHFPREFFKYIAIVTGIAAVLAFLTWLLRRAARPDRNLLLNRYREAYRLHTCPVCAFPIARGPLRYAVWSRKGPRIPGDASAATTDEETPYSCPSCGTNLFESCARCRKSRHSLLPYCEHCGAGGTEPC